MTNATVSASETPVSPPIWNPNAAANWCLIFTPAFGAYLHMLNWRALGENDRAATSMKWFYVAIGLLVLYALIAVTMQTAAEGLTWLIGFVFLLSWYFGSARSQAKYVKEKYGGTYVRLPWGKPLGFALGGLLCFLVLSFAVGVAAALLK